MASIPFLRASGIEQTRTRERRSPFRRLPAAPEPGNRDRSNQIPFLTIDGPLRYMRCFSPWKRTRLVAHSHPFRIAKSGVFTRPQHSLNLFLTKRFAWGIRLGTEVTVLLTRNGDECCPKRTYLLPQRGILSPPQPDYLRECGSDLRPRQCRYFAKAQMEMPRFNVACAGRDSFFSGSGSRAPSATRRCMNSGKRCAGITRPNQAPMLIRRVLF
jgi:hypothetical protein